MTSNSPPSRQGIGLYLPDNRNLDDLLTRAPLHGVQPDYAAYLLHQITAKRYMDDLDGKGFARLNASILRSSIPARALSATKRYLLSEGALITAPYSAQHFSTGYVIASAFDALPRRRVVEHPGLAGKLRVHREKYKSTHQNETVTGILSRRLDLLNHQRDSLVALSVSEPLAELVRLTPEADPGHVQFIAQCIRHHDHDGLTVDYFGWRLHSIVTRTSSHLRPQLLLNGSHVAEVDVANSQPLLLAILARTTYEANAQHIEQAHYIMEGLAAGAGVSCSLPSLLCLPCLGADSVIASDSLSFLDSCESGLLYNILAADCSISRELAKKNLFRDVLFCKPHVCGRITRAFERRWPSLLAWVRAVKKRYGYKIIAQALQRLESVIMLDCIGNRIIRELPGVPFLTIHDSAMLVADSAADVQRIMVEEFARWGVKANVRIK